MKKENIIYKEVKHGKEYVISLDDKNIVKCTVNGEVVLIGIKLDDWVTTDELMMQCLIETAYKKKEVSKLLEAIEF